MSRHRSRLCLAIAGLLTVLAAGLPGLPRVPAAAGLPGPPPADAVGVATTDDPPAPPVDVPDDHPFATEIRWLVADGVAVGYADGSFGPARPVSRGALAGLLFRLDQPGDDPTPCHDAPYDDVPADHPFCGAIAWAAGERLLGGYADGRFRPGWPVSRQALAAAVHRLVEGPGEPAPACTGAPFADVSIDQPFCPEVAWLAGHQVLAGYADGSFRPTATVSRQVAAAVLHRLMARGFVLDPRPPEPEWYDGPLDGFYAVPDPLPWGPPGQLIRLQQVSTNSSSTTLRIMYHSRDAQGRDRAVTGLLTRPHAPAPEGGWPVVSTAHGTTGIQTACAPSRAGGTASTYGIVGVGVRTDYIGLGPIGELHPYLSRPSEGHSVIDAVRAAHQLLGDDLSGEWLALGGSQGGHGALAASELGEQHAPELDLLGTVALAPAAVFDKVYGPVDQIVTRVVGIMMLYGAATEHPEIDPLDYVSDTTAAAAGVLETGCSNDVIAVMAPLAIADGFWKADPTTTEPARSLLLANDVGHVAAASPVLLVSGTADTTVPIDRSRDLNARLCASGQVTRFIEVEGADHGNVHAMAATEISAWLAARLTGAPAPNTCP